MRLRILLLMPMKEGLKTAADETGNVPMKEGMKIAADRECTDGRNSKAAADGTGTVPLKRRSMRIPL
jgi:hypothetical protein